MSVLNFFYNLPTSIFGAMSTTGLLNRLKAKLSSQQFSPKEISTLAERENETQQKALNQSICDAVSAVISSDEFTKAVAIHLASELKPSLKALDPSTYSTKIQFSTDKISRQFEAQDTKLTHLSTILESSNSNTVGKITVIETALNNIVKTQRSLEENLKSVEAQQSSQLNSVAAEIVMIKEKLAALNISLSEQLESAKADVAIAAATLSPELTSTFKTVLKSLEENSIKLDEIKATDKSKDVLKTMEENSIKLYEIKSTDKTAEVLKKLGENSTKIDKIIAADKGEEMLTSIQAFSNLQSTHTEDLGKMMIFTESNLKRTDKLQSDTDQISTILATTRDQINSINSLLSESKNSEVTAEILAGTKTSNELHAKCTGILEEISSRHLEILPAISVSNSLHENHSKSLTEIKKIESEILDGLKSTVKNLSDQSKILVDTKNLLTNEVATATSLATTSDSLEKLKSDFDCMNASLNDIKSIIASIAPTGHKFGLSELESSINTISTSIGEIMSSSKSLSEKIELAPIISSLETQTSDLSDIKSNLVASVPATEKAVQSSMKEISQRLNYLKESLDEVKAMVKLREQTATPYREPENP